MKLIKVSWFFKKRGTCFGDFYSFRTFRVLSIRKIKYDK